MYKIRWTTRNREWEKQTGLPRPIYILDENNQPIALHPRQTWIHLMTQFSIAEDQGDGNWLLKFVQPVDPDD